MYRLYDFYSEHKYCYAVENLAFVKFEDKECPNCGKLASRELVYQGEDSLLIDGANRYPDFMHLRGVGSGLFISERTIEVFLEEKFTGYDIAKKVPLYRSKYGKLLKQKKEYHTINIAGCIDLDLKAMTLKKKHICPICGSYEWNRQRLGIIPSVLDMSTWDGSDLCRIKSFPGFVMVSDRFKEIAEKYKFTGITFKPENEIFKI